MAGDNLEVTKWRFRSDTIDPNVDGDWLGAELERITVSLGQPFRIRFAVFRNATTGGSIGRAIMQQHGVVGFSKTTSSSSEARLNLSSFYAHQDESTELFLSTAPNVILPNTGLIEAGGNDQTGTIQFPDSGLHAVEIEVTTIIPVGGPVNPGDTVLFRLRRTNGNKFGDGHVNPLPGVTVADPGATRGAGFIGSTVVGSGSLGPTVAGAGFMGPTTKGAGIIRPGG